MVHAPAAQCVARVGISGLHRMNAGQSWVYPGGAPSCTQYLKEWCHGVSPVAARSHPPRGVLELYVERALYFVKLYKSVHWYGNVARGTSQDPMKLHRRRGFPIPYFRATGACQYWVGGPLGTELFRLSLACSSPALPTSWGA